MQKKTFSISELAAITKTEPVGDVHLVICDVCDLENALESHLSFLSNPSYLQAMLKSKAGAIIVDRQTPRSDGKSYLISDNPSKSFQQILEIFHPPQRFATGFQKIHPSAVIHPSVLLAEDVSIGPQVVIDEGAKVGKGSFIGSGSYLGPNTTIGDHCILHPRVTIREGTLIGDRVIIQPGAVIGSCGFGYLTEKGCHLKLNQVGHVEIEDDVEIGANTTIDRARFGCTKIKKGSKIDNLVQIGHGVEIGEHNLIVSQVGFSGSSKTGQYVVVGGQAGIAGHLEIQSGTQIAAKSGVSKSLTKGQYGGVPAMPFKEYQRNLIHLRNIEKLEQTVKDLEKAINSLKGA